VRESENAVATMSSIPLLPPQANKRISGHRTKVIRLETADGHGPGGEKEPYGDGGVDGRTARTDGASEREMSKRRR
jgi:hypothetical protein